MADPPETPPDAVARPGATGRRALLLGAAGATAVISVRPAFAAAQASIMTCEIQVPDTNRAGRWVAPDGSLVEPGTRDAVRGKLRPFRAEDVRQALAGGQLPGTTYEENRAYTAYIRSLKSGTPGFTCFASLQMPRG